MTPRTQEQTSPYIDLGDSQPELSPRWILMRIGGVETMLVERRNCPSELPPDVTARPLRAH